MIQPTSPPPLGLIRKQPQTANQPKFSGPCFNDIGKKALNYVDFRELGSPHLDQIKIIYTCCILWRLVAANERRKATPTKSWNEIRESMFRDFVGFMFWFFGTPTLQRAFLGLTTSPEIRTSLIQHNQEKGSPLRKFNPLYNWDIPTSEQVKEQMEQALAALEKKGCSRTEPAYQATEKFYGQLTKARNLATGVGMLTTIALLGVGINLLNIHLTRKDMARRKAEALKGRQYTAPHPTPAVTSSFQHATPTMGARQPFKTAPANQFHMGTTSTQPLYGNGFTPASFNPNQYARLPNTRH
jgi:hypothetical protein